MHLPKFTFETEAIVTIPNWKKYNYFVVILGSFYMYLDLDHSRREIFVGYKI